MNAEESDPELRLVELYRAASVSEAHLIRMALEETGIPVRLEGEQLQGGLGDLPVGWATAPRVLVDESRLEEAREIVEQSRLRYPAAERIDRQDDSSRCLACGARMTEEEVRCPACGWTFEDEESGNLP